MFFIFSMPVLIRHLWKLKTVVFLQRCLVHAVILKKCQRSAAFKAKEKIGTNLKSWIFSILLRIFLCLKKVAFNLINLSIGWTCMPWWLLPVGLGMTGPGANLMKPFWCKLALLCTLDYLEIIKKLFTFIFNHQA